MYIYIYVCMYNIICVGNVLCCNICIVAYKLVSCTDYQCRCNIFIISLGRTVM